MVIHKLNNLRMIVIELEGDGAGPFFTARSWDMQTWRIARAEVEIEEIKPEIKNYGQYL